MEREQIKKIVREATDKHLYVVNGNTVEAFEKTLIEALHQALSMSCVIKAKGRPCARGLLSNEKALKKAGLESTTLPITTNDK